MKYSTHRVVFGEIRFLPRIIIPATFLLFIFFGVNMLFPPVHPTTFAEDDTTSITTPSTTTPNDASTISISPVSNVSIPVTPSANAKVGDASTGVGTGSTAVTVTTNAAAGYTLSMNTDTADASLKKGTSTENETIPTLGSGTYTLSSMPVNSWGFSKDGTNYQAVPNSTTTATDKIIKKTNTTAVAGDTTDLSFAIKMNLSKSYGAYTNNLVFTAVVNTIPYSITFNENGGDASSLPSPNPMTGSTEEATVTLPTTVPTRTGYDFVSWCTVQSSDTSCPGIAYNPGDPFILDHTGATSSATLYAIWTLPPAITFDRAYKDAGKTKDSTTGLYKMQDMTTDICTAVTAPTSATAGDEQTSTLVDTRDGKIYNVAKLADDNCWMTQNLDLDITPSGLSSEDSDLGYSGGSYPSTTKYWDSSSAYRPRRTETTTSSSTTQTDIRSWDLGDYYYNGTTATSCGTTATSYADCEGKGFSTTGDSHYHVGNLYQWNAATAGTGGTITSKEATDSICPKGWKLPTSSTGGDFQVLSNTYGITSGTGTSGTVQKLIDAPLYMVRGGQVGSGTLRGAAGNGYYWSSTAPSNINYAYNLYFSGISTTAPSNSANRYYGRSVRCIAH